MQVFLCAELGSALSLTMLADLYFSFLLFLVIVILVIVILVILVILVIPLLLITGM